MINTELQQYMTEMVRQVDAPFVRYASEKVDWNQRMLGIVGPRGVGKTTLILQRLKMQGNGLYVSGDHSYFDLHTLTEVAREVVMEGMRCLYIDEIHKYPNWSRELKQIYDTHPDLHIVFTGSSILDILRGQADLSRRAVVYQMQGLSFREYLQIVHNIAIPVHSLDDVLSGRINNEALPHPLPLFREYLRTGYYPYSREGEFYTRTQQIVQLTLESDIPQFASYTVSTGRKLRRLMMIVAESSPFKPDYTSIANALKSSRNDIPEYLLWMERAGMIGQLRSETGGVRSLGKVEKVYLDNTNLMYALVGEHSEIGNIRETFFYNQVRVVADVISSKISDFMVDGHTFEVGGRSKSRKQVADVADAYVVRDDIEFAMNRILPLWTFGLLY